ncbi:MAG TPA: hypothetical protein VGD65_15030 [Chryseosolibacter sp.]
MPSIVQFLHSGREHRPENPPSNNYKDWNKGDHLRKFLRAEGEYVLNNSLKKAELCFWGEWEPQSHVSPLLQNGNKFFPKWLHTRDLIHPIPNKPKLQNTDPFVFDHEFKYFVCHQVKKKRKSARVVPTALAKLDVGSLILFGSKATDNGNAVFLLDTVFVVSDFIEYNPRVSPLTTQHISQAYYDYVYGKLFSPAGPDVDLRLYMGATFGSKVDGMYSFVPSQVFDPDRKAGFARVPFNNSSPYISPEMTQGFKVTRNLTPNQVTSFWNTVVSHSRKVGCVEGVHFY